ncbi:MAG: hypothetical protein II668_00990 [Oscillospiraceae bacterium]|nr:hypothetical protein [Oscillospiraceae bacterium]MBQ3951127.1 hypothetical protein [Oscillospiraceae bacterium]
MNVYELVDKYRIYTAHFNKTEYPAFFEKYRSGADEYFSGIERENVAPEVKALVDALEAEWNRHRFKFRREAVREDDKLLLALFLAPACLEIGSDISQAFARELSMEWNERFPDSIFRVGTYAQINKGFSRGIKLPWLRLGNEEEK